LPDLRRRGRTVRLLAAAAALLLVAVATASAQDAGRKVPRFVSLHADKVNLRTGPGRQYPIEWVLTRRDMPVQIIAQFEHWRRIRDWEGTEGWVQEHMLTGKRTVVVGKGGARALFQRPDPAGPVVARAEPGVVARLAECRGAWCRVETDEVAGWIKRSDVWGVFPDETVP
jgi:SH3-like domain-containing protein